MRTEADVLAESSIFPEQYAGIIRTTGINKNYKKHERYKHYKHIRTHISWADWLKYAFMDSSVWRSTCKC